MYLQLSFCNWCSCINMSRNLRIPPSQGTSSRFHFGNIENAQKEPRVCPTPLTTHIELFLILTRTLDTWIDSPLSVNEDLYIGRSNSVEDRKRKVVKMLKDVNEVLKYQESAAKKSESAGGTETRQK
jgi:hypothetical protein